MTNQQQNAARSAVEAFVTGNTLELGIGGDPIQGTRTIDGSGENADVAFGGLGGVEPGTVDAIVSIDGPGHCHDIVICLYAWRSALREGGTLALAFTDAGQQGAIHRWTANAFVSITQIVGGFRVASIEEIDGGFLFVGERSEVSIVRSPLGLLGPDIANACARNPAVRTEFDFQIGTMLLQANDPAAAMPHFESVLAAEPGSADARFGRGMCLARLGRWTGSLDELQRCLALDPKNQAIRSWVELVRDRAQQAVSAATQQGATAQQGATTQQGTTTQHGAATQHGAPAATDPVISPQSAASPVPAPGTPVSPALSGRRNALRVPSGPTNG